MDAPQFCVIRTLPVWLTWLNVGHLTLVHLDPDLLTWTENGLYIHVRLRVKGQKFSNII